MEIKNPIKMEARKITGTKCFKETGILPTSSNIQLVHGEAQPQSQTNQRTNHSCKEGFGHAARRPEGELIKDLLLSTLPQTLHRPAEDVGNHDQSRPGAPPRPASLRLGQGPVR